MNILLIPQTKTAAAVRQCLLQWSRAGLLRPFCCWTASRERTLDVELVSEGGTSSHPFSTALEVLADGEPVHLIAFFPTAQGDPISDEFAEQVAQFGEVADEVIETDGEAPWRTTMVVAPSIARQYVPTTLFRAQWRGLYVVPEDRREPGSLQPNALVGHAERFPAHAAHAAATLCSFWSDPREHQPRLLERLAALRNDPLDVSVRVVRCFSRCVELGYITDHLAAETFAQHDGWPTPEPDAFIQEEAPQRLVSEVVTDYLKQHAGTLTARPFKMVELRPESISLRRAFGELLDTIADYLQRRPLELVENQIEQLHDRAAQRIEQLSGTRRHIRRWSELPAAERDRGLEPMRELLAERLTVADGDIGATWFDLRTLALGLVDGSDLPSWLSEKLRHNERRLVVGDPAYLTDPAPSDGAEDPRDPFERPLLQQVRWATEAALAQEQQNVEQCETMLEAAERAAQEKWDPQARRDQQRSALRSLVRRTAVRAGIGFGGAVGGAVVLAGTPLVVIVALLLVVSLTAWSAAHDAQHVLLRQLDDDQSIDHQLYLLNRSLELAQARADVVRLRRRLRELDRWIELLAELLHRPWVPEPFGRVPLPPLVDEESLPRAFAVAAAEPDRDRLRRIGASTRRRAFHTGWLASIYRGVERLAIEQYRVTSGSTRTVDPTAETAGRDSAFSALHATVMSGDGRRLSDNPFTRDLLRAIGDTQLDELAPEVRTLADGGRPLPPTTTWFAPPLGFSELAERMRSHVVTIDGVAAGVIVAARVAVTAAEVVAGRSSAHVTTMEGTVVTTEEITFPENSGLALLHFAEDVRDGEIEVADIPQSADGVAILEAGRADARWGFVTRAGERAVEVVCAGERPDAGAAYFNLHGHLVALQTSRLPARRMLDIAELLAMPSGDGADGPSLGSLREPESAPPTGRRFLHQVVVDEPRSLWVRHWTQWNGNQHQVELAFPEESPFEDNEVRVGQLLRGIEFIRPLRLMLHRAEATLAVPPEALASCAPPPEAPPPEAPPPEVLTR